MVKWVKWAHFAGTPQRKRQRRDRICLVNSLRRATCSSTRIGTIKKRAVARNRSSKHSPEACEMTRAVKHRRRWNQKTRNQILHLQPIAPAPVTRMDLDLALRRSLLSKILIAIQTLLRKNQALMRSLAWIHQALYTSWSIKRRISSPWTWWSRWNIVLAIL